MSILLTIFFVVDAEIEIRNDFLLYRSRNRKERCFFLCWYYMTENLVVKVGRGPYGDFGGMWYLCSGLRCVYLCENDVV